MSKSSKDAWSGQCAFPLSPSFQPRSIRNFAPPRILPSAMSYGESERGGRKTLSKTDKATRGEKCKCGLRPNLTQLCSSRPLTHCIVPSTPALPRSQSHCVFSFMLQVSTSTSLLSVLRFCCPTAAGRRGLRSSPRRDARQGSTAATRGFDNSGTHSLH